MINLDRVGLVVPIREHADVLLNILIVRILELNPDSHTFDLVSFRIEGEFRLPLVRRFFRHWTCPSTAWTSPLEIRPVISGNRTYAFIKTPCDVARYRYG